MARTMRATRVERIGGSGITDQSWGIKDWKFVRWVLLIDSKNEIEKA